VPLTPYMNPTSGAQLGCYNGPDRPKLIASRYLCIIISAPAGPLCLRYPTTCCPRMSGEFLLPARNRYGPTSA